MSATLRVEDFRENKRLFPKELSGAPNCINVQTRQFPVSIVYAKETKADYMEASFKKVVKIHENLPHGGILVFLTGKKEIQELNQRLKLHFRSKGQKHNVKIQPLYS
jgi:ATP-dependent RNA helicase DHX37/DHR1